MMRSLIRSDKGQTSLEYLLLIVVVTSMGILFMKKMDEYILKNPNSFVSKPLNAYKQSLGSPQNGYKYFPLSY